MTSAGQPVIVVGVSGSAASAGALRWAAAEAGRRQARLHVVCAWEEAHPAPYAPAAGRPSPGQQQAAAGARLAALIREAFRFAPPAGLSTELAHGLAARALADRSAGAELLVLGSAAPAGEARWPVGPVLSACLHGSQCPVVVVVCPGTPARRPDEAVPAPA
ncbi:MAG TPA: universal stress protein [Streptosporangiaceae bacterium]|nr:universal stress protein [Streptosporangiaceae bacterium]